MAERKKRIKVLLADDHEVLRDGLASLIADQTDMEVVATVGTGRSAVRMADKIRPDVVVMDIGMPDLNGIDATRKIVGKLPGVRVLSLSIHKDRNTVESMLRAGASGYLVKNCAVRELIDAIKTVAEGKTYVSPTIAGHFVEGYIQGRSDNPENACSRLSVREREILQLIAEGRNTKEIAYDLDISDKTVAAHRLSLMAKLNLHTIADLTRYAIRQGLVEA